jgi:hypothetical protein
MDFGDFTNDASGSHGVHPYGPGPKVNLPTSPGRGPGMTGALSTFPASSALAAYPSPFAERRVAETRDDVPPRPPRRSCAPRPRVRE